MVGPVKFRFSGVVYMGNQKLNPYVPNIAYHSANGYQEVLKESGVQLDPSGGYRLSGAYVTKEGHWYTAYGDDNAFLLGLRRLRNSFPNNGAPKFDLQADLANQAIRRLIAQKSDVPLSKNDEISNVYGGPIATPYNLILNV